MLQKCSKCGIERNLEIAPKCPSPRCFKSDGKIRREVERIERQNNITRFKPRKPNEANHEYTIFSETPAGSLKEYLDSLPKIVFTRQRNQETIQIRKQAIVTLREHYGLSYPQIGKLLKRDHSTIFSDYKSVRKLSI